MQVVHQRCCGIDVHKQSVVVCVLITLAADKPLRHVRTFSTMTADLLALDDWLRELHVEQVAIESTGVFWRPVFNLLEDGRVITLVNPRNMKAVPGRKTDVKDSEWLADLLRHGLLQPSFIPPKPIRELRELTRYRKSLVQERADIVNRIQKVLETANIKLAAVASDILGKSGRAMLDAIVNGEEDPTSLAELAKCSMRRKIPQLQQALKGRVEGHHRFLLARLLEQIDFLDGLIQKVQLEIDARLAPYEHAVERLQAIPGLGPLAAATIVAEIGVDMSRFASAKHLASWAGLCPGHNERGGKKLSGRMRKGNVWLRGVLTDVAWAVARTKDNYLSTQYQRIAQRRGGKRAAMATAHTILRIIYYMFRDGTPYEDLGSNYFDKLDKTRIQQHHIHRLEQLGYSVTLTPAATA